VPRVYAPLELNAYSEKPYYSYGDRKYSAQQLDYIMSADYSWFGTGNLYNNMLNWAAYKDNVEGDVNHKADNTYWY